VLWFEFGEGMYIQGVLTMKIKNYWLVTSLMILSVSSPAKAAGARFCDGYAQIGVAQHISNLAHSCNLNGLRWSANFIGQKAWCRTVRRVIAQAETSARRAALTACGVPANIRKPWSATNYQQKDAIIEAAVRRTRDDDVRSLRIFKREGVDLTREWGGNYGTVLFHAIDNQASKSVRYLIKIDDPNRTSNAGPNPLANMVSDPVVNYRLLRFLLRHGSNPNSFGELGGNASIPLAIAVKKRDLRAVKELIHIGHANPNFHDDAEETPLITALKNHDKKIAMLLIRAGANVNRGIVGLCADVRNARDDKMPLDYALEMGNRRVINEIKRRDGKTVAQCARP